MQKVVEISYNEEKANIDTKTLVSACDLIFFKADIPLTGVYKVQSEVSSENVAIFLDHLRGKPVTVTKQNCHDLKKLCEEFITTNNALQEQIDSILALRDELEQQRKENEALKSRLSELTKELQNKKILRYRAAFSNSLDKPSWTQFVEQNTSLEMSEKYTLHAIEFEYNGPGELMARGHVQSIGWMQWERSSSNMARVIGGDLNDKKRLEAVEFRLEKANSTHVDFTVNVLIATPQKNGAGKWDFHWQTEGLGKMCGTTGQAKKLVGFKMSMQVK